MIQGDSQKDCQQSKGSQSKYAEISAHPFVAFCLYQRVTVDFRCIWIFRNEYEEEMGKRREIFPAEIFIELHHFRRRCPYSIGNGFQPIANRGRGAFFKLTERQEIAGTNLFSPCPPERFPWHQERKLAGKLVKLLLLFTTLCAPPPPHPADSGGAVPLPRRRCAVPDG